MKYLVRRVGLLGRSPALSGVKALLFGREAKYIPQVTNQESM